jgi:hypothetical protein
LFAVIPERAGGPNPESVARCPHGAAAGDLKGEVSSWLEAGVSGTPIPGSARMKRAAPE